MDNVPGLKAAPNEKIIAQGLTHMRIDINGKIIFHQDYWDTRCFTRSTTSCWFLDKNRKESNPKRNT